MRQILFLLLISMSSIAIANSIQIFVVDLKGRSHTVDIDHTTTVEDLHRIVTDKTGIDKSSQRLSTGVKELIEGTLLGEKYNLHRESNVFLSLRLRGGSSGSATQNPLDLLLQWLLTRASH